MPKIDIDAAPTGHGTGYPEEFAGPCKPRRRWKLGDAVGLDQFGVNLLRLPAGAWSSQRHWHEGEDEFVWVLEGEVVLVEEGERQILRAGDCAAFPKGKADGHHLVNESAEPCVFLAIGRMAARDCHYPDIDLHLDGPTQTYRHKDGQPW